MQPGIALWCSLNRIKSSICMPPTCYRSGPCKTVEPIFVRLSEKYPGVVFWKVDVDICRVSVKVALGIKCVSRVSTGSLVPSRSLVGIRVRSG